MDILVQVGIFFCVNFISRESLIVAINNQIILRLKVLISQEENEESFAFFQSKTRMYV